MKCKHNHECEQCVRTEIKNLQDKIAELQEKLPPASVTYINHHHGCGCLGCSQKHVWTLGTIQSTAGAAMAIGVNTVQANYKALN